MKLACALRLVYYNKAGNELVMDELIGSIYCEIRISWGRIQTYSDSRRWWANPASCQ